VAASVPFVYRIDGKKAKGIEQEQWTSLDRYEEIKTAKDR